MKLWYGQCLSVASDPFTLLLKRGDFVDGFFPFHGDQAAIRGNVASCKAGKIGKRRKGA